MNNFETYILFFTFLAGFKFIPNIPPKAEVKIRKIIVGILDTEITLPTPMKKEARIIAAIIHRQDNIPNSHPLERLFFPDTSPPVKAETKIIIFEANGMYFCDIPALKKINEMTRTHTTREKTDQTAPIKTGLKVILEFEASPF